MRKPFVEAGLVLGRFLSSSDIFLFRASAECLTTLDGPAWTLYVKLAS